jgi:hypothetical protein
MVSSRLGCGVHGLVVILLSAPLDEKKKLLLVFYLSQLLLVSA